MTDERIIAYLLKELPEEELERFENECFASFASEDGLAQTQLSLAEEDLINDYLRNELAPVQRRSFEQNYLTTGARKERVRGAAALLRHVDACAPAAEMSAAPLVRKTWSERLRAWWGRPWMPRMAVALALAAFVVGAWLISRPPSAPKTFATLTLTVSYGDRAESAKAGLVKLSPDVDALRVLLTLPDTPPPAGRYRAQLEGEAGTVELSENVIQEAQSVPVTIPASQLTRGRYAIKLFAVKPDGTEQRVPGSYFFTVE